MQWVPQQGWAYSGGDWTVAISGNRGVFVETARTDFNQLFQVLVDHPENRCIKRACPANAPLWGVGWTGARRASLHEQLRATFLPGSHRGYGRGSSDPMRGRAHGCDKQRPAARERQQQEQPCAYP